MRVLYVASFAKGRNDNEGAIAHALGQLGCDVRRVEETASDAEWDAVCLSGYDLFLCQNWPRVKPLDALACPKVCWYMDRLGDDIPDVWSLRRRKWMARYASGFDILFATDGDWVAENRTGNLVHLMQGADARQASLPTGPGKGVVLFAGLLYGPERNAWADDLRTRWDFHHVRRAYGTRLASFVHNARIVLAPPSPVSDKYWSNRVYVMLNLGAFLLHPYCAGLADQYDDRREIVFYRSREEMHDLIAYYLDRPDERWAIQQAGFARTQREHTYLNRLAVILERVRSLDRS